MLNVNSGIKLPKLNKVIDIRAIRKANFPYIFIWVLYYAWVVAFTTWWTASPVTDNVFNTGLRSLIHSVNLISSAVFIFLIRKDWFVKTSRIGALMIITGMSTFLTVHKTPLQLASVIAIGITLGIVNISILIPFVFALNNTEKLYGVVGSFLLINLLLSAQHRFIKVIQPGSREQLGTFLLLILALSATLFFKKNSITKYNSDTEAVQTKPRIYITLVYNCILAVFCKGIGTALFDITAVRQGNMVYEWYYIGGLGGCLIYIIIHAFTKKAFVWHNNLTFGCVAMGLMCNAFVSELPSMAFAFAVFFGIGSTIGMINIYYILAVVGKKYDSMRYLRLSILFIGICGGVSGVIIGNLIYYFNTSGLSVIASLISAACVLIFLTLSPFLAQIQNYGDREEASEGAGTKPDINDRFKQYQLSKREAEVCRLLIEGYTLRQISAILSIAYSTVNTYCTSTYRKLNINSRTELIMLFKEYVK